jgi:Protein of unknown function (DUF3822)
VNKSKEKITNEVLTIKDKNFDVDRLEKYYLSLTISDHSLKCCVFEQKEKRILWFDHISWNGEVGILEALDEVYHEHEFLAAGFWKRILIVHDNPFCTLVPTPFFDEKKIKDVLESTFGPLDSEISARSTKHPELGFNSVYGSNEEVNSYFKKKYPKKQFLYSHSSDGILEFASGIASSKNIPELWLDWTGTNMKALLLRNGLLEFYNSYECQYEEDVAYFSASLIEQLELESDKISVKLSGDFESENSVFATLNGYFPRVNLAERPKLYYFGYQFDEVPDHKHLESFSSFFTL